MPGDRSVIGPVPEVGKKIKETDIRQAFGVTFLGTLEHGQFQFADLETEIHDSTTLVLAGTRSQFAAYNRHFNPVPEESTKWEKVIVIGGGVNSLVTANLLGQAGKKVLLLEAREQVGGMAATLEFIPGFKCNLLYDHINWIDPRILKKLEPS